MKNETHNRVPKFQLNTLRVKKVFRINQYPFKVSKLINKDLLKTKCTTISI